MEDPRISRMYAAMVRQKLSSMRITVWRAAVMRSGLLTTLVLVLLLFGLVVVVKERGRGHLSRLTSELKPKPPISAVAPIQPGGQDPIVLQRSQISGGTLPEFLSATLLPGRGMNVLQITAYLPEKGEVPLLVSPSLDEAAKQMNGTGTDAGGGASLGLGGAFEVPWADRMRGVANPGGTSMLVSWHGRTMSLPEQPQESAAGVSGGLLLKRRADSVMTNVMPDGGEAEGVYTAESFDGHWLSHTEVTTSVLLSSRALEVKVTARNTGTEAEPMGIGWMPRFAIPSGDRANAQLRMPNALRAEVRSDHSRVPTGKLLPVAGTQYDFTARAGAKLGVLALDDSFVDLKPGMLDNGPVVELRDMTGRFGLRMTMLTPTIKSIHVVAPSHEAMVSIGPQFNYDDPFGREWAKGQDTGMVVLEPGQTVEWKVRLELFALQGQESTHF